MGFGESLSRQLSFQRILAAHALAEPGDSGPRERAHFNFRAMPVFSGASEIGLGTID